MAVSLSGSEPSQAARAVLSQRVRAIKPSPSMAAKTRVDQLRAQGQDITDFTVGEPDMDTPAHIVEAGVQALRSGQTRYTSSVGTRALLQAVQAKFRRENGLDYGLDQLVVGTGAKQLIYTAFSATVDAGDEVIVPAPFWVSYPDMVLLNDGKPVIVPCTEADGFKLTPGLLENAITARSKWVLLNTPSNPTGALYTEAELRALIEVLRRHPHVWVLTDEIYEHLAYGDARHVSIAALDAGIAQRTLTINGVSKAYAMTGWRVGYAGGPAGLVKAMGTLISQSTSCVAAMNQAAAAFALSADQACVAQATALFKARRDRIVALLNAIPGIRCAQPAGAFYVYPGVEGLIGKKTPDGRVLESDLDVSMYLLDEAKVAVMDGTSYGLSPYLRLSFATSIEQIEIGCERIARACANLA
ncbi:aminotransferase class I/II-fold pyridoxal phosphate-dependent enzyme [Parapusillimonas granuli]|uniref:Aminotransferase n=1 Tax=Parapusillimonas granuli TaxID=380911 RepID=A0A853FX83_9BURK|nr:aminotransferase class I/II-fold pyridoxal phosphate-dependent enzyme [Parapusillimonas granuli]MBB5214845.1 aspartate aminotransferase [Parapusillimonas granuli]MEB2397907.1 aminotransferase class I/II-fold pyridoxal phosphate-dependent enzyme [Alcaligenaceae bacterium]NYT48747.1 aminotransferase class I/II-fold pyridoxal phosphate-dependent enzyme [Parapusillimonas granuli]